MANGDCGKCAWTESCWDMGPQGGNYPRFEYISEGPVLNTASLKN